ncbi:acyltransferase family protein [Mycobacterium sp. NPDC003449]
MQTTQSEPVLVETEAGRVRGDLTGLSGVAIVLVLVCQVWLGRVSGGIDILLVLAGFGIGGRMLGGLGATDLSAEVGWLARRLVPPLVLVLAACAALTIAVQPQTRWEAFADQTLATLGFYQNWELARTASEYVQPSEAVTPIQHLWVVSVVGQFFVVILVLALVVTAATRRGARRHREAILVAAAGLLTLASFGYAVDAHAGNQLTTYYSGAARMWEPLAGVLAAAVAARIRWPGWLRAATVVTGLTAIVSGSLLIDGAMEYPGPLALVPVGAAVLVILGAGQGAPPAWTDRLLGSRTLVTAGAMAYSLYLWHWPLLIFWLASIDDDAVGLIDGGAVIAVAAALAWITWRSVEQPWRGGALRLLGRPRLGSVGLIVLLVAVLAVMSLAWRSHVALARSSGVELSTLSLRDYPGALAVTGNRKVAKLPMRPTALEAPDDVPPTTVDKCVTDFPDEEVITCDYGDPNASRTIALAGGSHSEHWLTALHLLGRQHGFKVTTYLKMGCPLTTKPMPLLAGPFEPYPQCRTWSDAAMAQIIADRPDYVFFTTTRPVLNGAGDYVPDYYVGIWDQLSANGIPMLGVRDTPWMLREGMFFSPVDCMSAGGDADACGLPRREALAEHNPTLNYEAGRPALHVLDLSDAVCRADICRAVEGNVLVYHDAHHLSATYVRTLADELARQLSDATSWW